MAGPGIGTYLTALFGMTAGNVADRLKEERKEKADLRDRYGMERYRSQLRVGETTYGQHLRQNAPDYLQNLKQGDLTRQKYEQEIALGKQNLATGEWERKAQEELGFEEYNKQRGRYGGYNKSVQAEIRAREEEADKWLANNTPSDVTSAARTLKQMEQDFKIGRDSTDKATNSFWLSRVAEDMFFDIAVKEAEEQGLSIRQLGQMASHLGVYQNPKVIAHLRSHATKGGDVATDESGKSMGRTGGDNWKPTPKGEGKPAKTPEAPEYPRQDYGSPTGPAQAEMFTPSADFSVRPSAGESVGAAAPSKEELPRSQIGAAEAEAIPPAQLEEGIAALIKMEESKGRQMTREEAEQIVRQLWASRPRNEPVVPEGGAGPNVSDSLSMKPSSSDTAVGVVGAAEDTTAKVGESPDTARHEAAALLVEKGGMDQATAMSMATALETASPEEFREGVKDLPYALQMELGILLARQDEKPRDSTRPRNEPVVPEGGASVPNSQPSSPDTAAGVGAVPEDRGDHPAQQSLPEQIEHPVQKSLPKRPRQQAAMEVLAGTGMDEQAAADLATKLESATGEEFKSLVKDLPPEAQRRLGVLFGDQGQPPDSTRVGAEKKTLRL